MGGASSSTRLRPSTPAPKVHIHVYNISWARTNLSYSHRRFHFAGQA